MKIVIHSYQPEHQPWFEKFNRAWIEKYFWMEPIDTAVLQHPEEHIIRKGGSIFTVTVNDEFAGTVALKFAAPGVYEFTKMAVDDKFQGLGLGRALAEAAIAKAKEDGAEAIILYSSRKLNTAITLYRKLGFLEVPVDGTYARSDIKMKLTFDHAKHPFSKFDIRKATWSDVNVLSAMGKSTFEDTFAPMNTKEDMDLYVQHAYSIQQLSKELEEPGSLFLIAFDGSQEIGYAKLMMNNTPPETLPAKNAVELVRLYSIKEYIGKQVGSALMQACITLAEKHQADVLWLGVWEHNQPAIAFYEKWGFEKFASHPFLLGTDLQTDLLMKKNLQ